MLVPGVDGAHGVESEIRLAIGAFGVLRTAHDSECDGKCKGDKINNNNYNNTNSNTIRDDDDAHDSLPSNGCVPQSFVRVVGTGAPYEVRAGVELTLKDEQDEHRVDEKQQDNTVVDRNNSDPSDADVDDCDDDNSDDDDDSLSSSATEATGEEWMWRGRESLRLTYVHRSASDIPIDSADPYHRKLHVTTRGWTIIYDHRFWARIYQFFFGSEFGDKLEVKIIVFF